MIATRATATTPRDPPAPGLTVVELTRRGWCPAAGIGAVLHADDPVGHMPRQSPQIDVVRCKPVTHGVVRAAFGSPLTKHWDSLDIGAQLAKVGRDLALLQRSRAGPAPHRGVQSYIDEALVTGRTLARFLPHQAMRIEHIVTCLQTSAPAPGLPGFVHGDFHPGRVRIQGADLVFVGFDRARRGGTAVDVGSFLAHMLLAEANGQLSECESLARAFLAAYEETAGRRIEPARLRFYTLLGLFRACPRLFGALRLGRAGETMTILNSCEDLCG